MASHHLIEDYLDQLAARLSPDAVDELADGLTETWHRHRATGAAPDQAAQAAIAEFGSPQQITAAFVTHAPGRRTARALLATGPLIGLCWGGSLIAAHAWTWPIPPVAAAVYAAALLAVVFLLVVAATTRTNPGRTRLGGIGSAGLIVLDVTMIAAVAAIAPTLTWPMLAAIPASVARIAITVRTLPAALNR
jgi:hypothetical protein